MKAIQVNEFGPVSGVTIEDVAEPSPGRGEVVISASYMALNFPDFLLMQGNYQLKPSLPFTPGRDVSGVVSAIGEGVTRFRVGDRVCGQLEYGAFSELVLCPASQCFQLPDDLPLAEGAAMGLAHQTAYFALMERARFSVGDSVLVLGATGSVGLAAIQLVEALGGIAIAGVRNDVQAEIAKAGGARHVVNLNAENLKESLRDEVRTATNGKGVDIVVDPVGGDAFAAAIRCLAWRGRLVVVGFAAGKIPELRVNYLLLKNIEVSGLQWTDYRDFEESKVIRAQQHMYELYQQGVLPPPRIAKVYPFDQYQDALGALEHGGVSGRILLAAVGG